MQEVEVKVVLGDEAEVLATLGKSTAYVERAHLIMRHSNARLIRQGLGFSKDLIPAQGRRRVGGARLQPGTAS